MEKVGTDRGIAGLIAHERRGVALCAVWSSGGVRGRPAMPALRLLVADVRKDPAGTAGRTGSDPRRVASVAQLLGSEVSEVAEYDCEGCGVHVSAFGIREPPAHRFCVTCAWLSVHLEPEEIMEALRRCEAMGHPSRQVPSAKTPYRTAPQAR